MIQEIRQFLEIISTFFINFGDAGLLLYSFFKAWLPLLSVEVVQLPLTLLNPSKWFLYAFYTIIATIIGSTLGYYLGAKIGLPILKRFAKPGAIKKGQELIAKNGILAIGIGSLLPIPDFLVIYLAGICRMNFWTFTIVNGVARSIRSLLLGYGTFLFGKEVSSRMNVDMIMLYIVLPMLALYAVYKIWDARKEKKEEQRFAKEQTKTGDKPA